MILKKIKEQTQESHTSLENSQFLRPISDKSLTLEQYISILEKFYGFFHPLELEIGKFPVEQYLPDFSQRRKSGLLMQDLQHITKKTLGILPICQDLPQIDTLEQAFGCLYVMEGSTLGGKMIYKMVNERLEIDYNNGVSFFYGYGPDTGPKWKDFQQSLQTVSSTHSQADTRMIEAANNTFDKLNQWFENNN